MFDVGFAELFLLSIIGLLVLGPERLPAVARTLGGFVRKARASWYTLKTTVEAELAAADVSEPLQTARKELDEVTRQVTDLGREASAGAEKLVSGSPGESADGTDADDKIAPGAAETSAENAETMAPEPGTTEKSSGHPAAGD